MSVTDAGATDGRTKESAVAAPDSVWVMLKLDCRTRVVLESLTDSLLPATLSEAANLGFELWLISTGHSELIEQICDVTAEHTASQAESRQVISFQIGTKRAYEKGAGLRLRLNELDLVWKTCICRGRTNQLVCEAALDALSSTCSWMRCLSIFM